MNLKFAVTLSSFAQYDTAPRDLLQNFDCVYNNTGKRLNREEVVELCRDCDGIIAGVEPYDAYVLAHLPNLRCISRCGVGTDNIDLEKAQMQGVAIKNTPDVVTLPVAELTVGMIFDLLRKLSYYTSLMRSHQWKKTEGSLLSGRKVGVLGLGRIGKKVSEMLTNLGAFVYGTDLHPDRNWATRNQVQIVSMDYIIKECDIITIHVASQKSENLIIGSKEIAVMKKGSLLINTSRGKFLDEAALYSALKSNHLGGAALDVYSEEPYSGPLCDLENAVLTPHIATLTKESRIQMEIEAVTNLTAFFKDSP
jgi:D-3-phosphoglycerate dehydrogenase / 2-oxoglutarate reductase